MSDLGLADVWLPVSILFAALLAAYLLMWRGWRRRASRHDLPELHPVPSAAADQEPPVLMEAAGRYFGTTAGGDWLDRVVARGLGAQSACELTLAQGGLDVVLAGRSFRIPAAELRAARHDQGIAGKVVPPHGLLVVSWRHGDHLLDSGFRLDPGGSGRRRPSDLHDDWIRAVGSVAEAAGGRGEPGRHENHEEHTP